MRKAGLATMLSVSLLTGSAQADTGTLPDWYRQARAAMHSLLGQAVQRDMDVIAPPANIDPKMALVPPGSARMRIIAPSSRARP